MVNTAGAFSGWRVSLSLAILASTGIALSNVFGVVFEPIAHDLEIDRTLIGLGMSIMMFSVGLTAPIMGRLADVGPIRPYMVAGVIAMLAGIAIMTHTSSGWLLALGMFICCVGICFHGMVPCNAIANNWFIKQRAKSLSMIAIGLSVGGLWLPPAAAWLMTQGSVENDWRFALQVLSAGLAVIALLVIAFGVIRRPEDVGQLPDGDAVTGDLVTSDENAGAAGVEEEGGETGDAAFAEAKKSRDLWFLAISFGLLTFSTLTNGAFLVPFLEERGASKIDASFALSVVAFASIVGSLTAGVIADKSGPKKVLLAAQSMLILAFLVLLFIPSYSSALLASAAAGFGLGAFMPMQPTTAGARFGRAIAGRVIGVFGITQLPFTLMAIPVAAYLASTFGSYSAAYVLALCSMLCSLILVAVSRLGSDG